MPCSVIQEAARRRLRGLGLPRGARILDAPCGAGDLAAALAADGFEVAAADLDLAAAPALGDRLQRADLNGALPWPDARFDAVLSIEGLEHLESPWTFLREVRRVLRPGGLLLLTTPNTLSLRSRVRFFASGFYHRDATPLDESRRDPLHHIGLRTFPELRYMLHTSGFQLRAVSHTHWKPVSFAYAVYAPWMWLYTRVAFRREKDHAQRARNREIRAALFTPSLLFGENLLLVAERAA
jgi:2-polyprenyl-3-methyl-5-hydroxy-6-metoxy-1,4-benzoquinol methylase